MGEAGLEPAKPEARGLQPRVIAAIRLSQINPLTLPLFILACHKATYQSSFVASVGGS